MPQADSNEIPFNEPHCDNSRLRDVCPKCGREIYPLGEGEIVSGNRVTIGGMTFVVPADELPCICDPAKSKET